MKHSEVLRIPLEALHCRSCAVRIERRLQREPGVVSATVSASERTAEIHLQEGARLQEIYGAFRSALAEPSVTSVSIPLAGIAGSEQQAIAVEQHVRELPGVSEARVDLSTGELFATYTPGVADADAIRRAVEAHGWIAAHPDAGSHVIDETQRTRRRRLLLRGSLIALAAAVGTAIAGAAPIASADPLLGVVPILRTILQDSVVLAPALAHSLLAILTALSIGFGGNDLIRGAWIDLRTRAATGRLLGVLAVLTLAIGSLPSLIAAFAGQTLASFWTTALWAEALLLFSLAYGESLRLRERRAGAAAPRPPLLDRASRRPMEAEHRGVVFSAWIAMATLAVALVAAGAWLSAPGGSWPVALLTFASVLLVAVPGIPAILAPLHARRTATALQRRGAFVAASDSFERIADAKVVCFTLRGGIASDEIAIQELVLLDGIPQQELLAAAAAACAESKHPLCDLIRARAGQFDRTEHDLLFGNPEVMEARNVDLTRLREEIDRFESDARPVLVVARGRTPLGAIVLRSDPRERASEIGAALKKRGLRLVLATGQTETAAAAAARHAGIERFGSGLDDLQKSELVRQLSDESGPVIYVGDGGDPLARTRASAGIVFGAPEAMVRDDVGIADGDLGSVLRLVDSSRALVTDLTRRKTLAVVWHLAAFAFAAGALVPLDLLPSPALAALAALVWTIWSGRPPAEGRT